MGRSRNPTAREQHGRTVDSRVLDDGATSFMARTPSPRRSQDARHDLRGVPTVAPSRTFTRPTPPGDTPPADRRHDHRAVPNRSRRRSPHRERRLRPQCVHSHADAVSRARDIDVAPIITFSPMATLRGAERADVRPPMDASLMQARFQIQCAHRGAREGVRR